MADEPAPSTTTDLSDEQPSSRAEAAVLRESTGFQFEVKLGPIEGKGSATTESRPTSPSAIALTTLLLTVAASVAVLVLSLAGAVLGAPAAVTVIAAGVLFLGVFATGVWLVCSQRVPDVLRPRPPGGPADGEQ